MGRISKHISPEDEKFIEENHKLLTIREICDKRRLNYNNVWNYMEHRGLSKHTVRNKPVRKKKKNDEDDEDESEMFDADKFDNWMI